MAKEMTHDLEVNFDKMTPFRKEDTAKEMQNHAGKTLDTRVGAVEIAEVAEIECAVRRAKNHGATIKEATIKKFDIKENFQLEHIDHEQVAEKQQAASRVCDDAHEDLNTRMNEESMEPMTAAELIEKPGLLNLRHRQRTRG